MPISVYLNLILLSLVNLILLFIIFGLPRRKSNIEKENYEEDRSVRHNYGILKTIVVIIVISIMLGLLFIFVTVTFLYELLADIVLVGFSMSVLYYSRNIRNLGKKSTLLLILFILLGSISVGYYGWYAQVNNAYYFNHLLEFKSGNTLFSNSTLKLGELPLVSEDYARSIASSHLSEFGGSVQLVDEEQIVHQGQPYWIFTVAPTNTFAENHELGFVLVDAVNGSYIDVKSPNSIGPGLFMFNEIDFHSFLGDTTIVIGNHYPTPSLQSNSIVYYVFTQNQVQLDGVTAFNGGTIYGSDGSMVSKYEGLDSPTYVNQPWDKFLVSQLAKNWGSTRSGNNTFSVFAGGFFTIPASQFRLALSTDEELIPYRNGTAFMLFVSPANAPNSLVGVILTYRDRFSFYDMQGMNLISPDYAKATVQSKLPALSSGNLFTANPVIYPSDGKFIWIVPYYYDSGVGIVQFQGIAVMDASNAGNLIIQEAQGGIEQTRDTALASLLGGGTGNQTKTTQIDGIIQDILSYVQNGSTYLSIEINGTYYYATPSSLYFEQWVQALRLKIGDTVKLQVEEQKIVQLNIGT